MKGARDADVHTYISIDVSSVARVCRAACHSFDRFSSAGYAGLPLAPVECILAVTMATYAHGRRHMCLHGTCPRALFVKISIDYINQSPLHQTLIEALAPNYYYSKIMPMTLILKKVRKMF